ncbi:Uncharacterized protein MCB1EB_0400 [Mycoavidus cysteinexigens]|uniref:Uncharacterized protein n=1 Tax=Mycoavidus cysteinexigens TaxID=1553431 RepID=A0A2Z6ET46_9BURK|nr:hypothetical protein [Mycoavidus cysteinexigens]BBE08561.1 Uncharacterized protein MCB1EB_0400 [Mycoavidus cysteinexigens]GAM52736.1 hypothetical protein EBME_1199 [bacterium endosymbiont of Mortierella elongata FMR23-6]GLR00412.1 hypothetical protein GCM10007934_02230 [Mycoavidus cysteinexigens]
MGNIRDSENDPAILASIWIPEFDREPTSISLAEVAEADAFNASVCWQWREQALGLREFYQQLQNSKTKSVNPFT